MDFIMSDFPLKKYHTTVPSKIKSSEDRLRVEISGGQLENYAFRQYCTKQEFDV